MSNRGTFPLGGDKPLPPGPLSARPASTGSGRIYVSTDNGGTTYQDTTVGWLQLGQSVIDPRLNLSNVNPAALRKSRLALAKAQTAAASGVARLALAAGDSTSAGAGATIGTTDWFSQLVSLLGTRGFVSGGIAAVNANNPGYWAFSSAWSGLNSSFYNGATALNATATYTSPNAGTTLRFQYTDTAFSGSFTYAVDGGSAVTVTCTGSGVPKTISVTGLANTTHTLVITNSSTSGLYAIWNAWVESAYGLVTTNAALGGSTTSDWAGTSGPALSFSSVLNFAPDLAFLMVGINNISNGVGPASTYADMVSMIRRLQAVGSDVIVISPIPASPAARSAQGQASTLAAIKQATVDTGVPLLDLYDRFGLGPLPTGYSGDGLHGTPGSYGEVARAVSNLVGI